MKSIDQTIFSEAMSVLADRFNRPLHPATLRKYHETLSRELGTEEFVAAAEIAFRDSTFWPSPRELIEYVKPMPDLTLEATVAFDKVLALGFPHPAGTCWKREQIQEELGMPASVAFTAIGAQGRLRSITTDDLPFARREFISAYRASALHREKETSAARALQGFTHHAPLLAGSGNA